MFLAFFDPLFSIVLYVELKLHANFHWYRFFQAFDRTLNFNQYSSPSSVLLLNGTRHNTDAFYSFRSCASTRQGLCSWTCAIWKWISLFWSFVSHQRIRIFSSNGKPTKQLRRYGVAIWISNVFPLVNSQHVGWRIHIAAMKLTQNPRRMEPSR